MIFFRTLFTGFVICTVTAFHVYSIGPATPGSRIEGTPHPDTGHRASVDTLKYWNLTVNGRLNLNQVAFTNWAEGGENSVAANTYGTMRANFLRNQVKSDNFLAMAYGLTWNNEQGFRKTDDKLDAGVSLGFQAFDDWFYNLMLNLKTQFSAGYKYPDDSVMVSRFFSPATLYISMGMEYKPDENTSVFLSPASGKFIFVMDEQLANKGAFGVTPAVVDSLGIVIRPGLNYKSNFGINLVVQLDRELLRNVNLETRLNLHNNYLDESFSNRWNFDVDWETAFNFRINSFLSSVLYIHLMYDDDIPVPTYETIGGERVETGQGPRLQVKENFGIGLSLKV